MTGGFSLIELVAVLAVMAVVTGVASVSLRGVKWQTDADALLTELSALDESTRQRAARHRRPWQIVLDLAARNAWAEPVVETTTDTAEHEAGRGRSVSWNADPSITRAWQLPGQAISATQIVILVDASGRSPDYAVQMSTGLAEQRSAEYIVVAGDTGQNKRTSRKEDLDAWATMVAGPWPDAR